MLGFFLEFMSESSREFKGRTRTNTWKQSGSIGFSASGRKERKGGLGREIWFIWD